MKNKNLLFALILSLSTIFGWAQAPVNLSIAPARADIISFQGEVGRSYAIECTTNLNSGTNGWSTLTVLSPTADGKHSHTNFPVSGARTFYRTSTQRFDAVPALVSLTTYKVSNEGMEVAIFEFSINITAVGGDVYLNGTNGIVTTNTPGMIFEKILDVSGDITLVDGNYLIEEGTTTCFNLVGMLQSTNEVPTIGMAGVTSIKFGASSTNSLSSYERTNGLEEFKRFIFME